MWKFQNFSTTQILREFNSAHFVAPKTAILTISKALNLELLGMFDIFKCEILPQIKIQSLRIC